MFSLPVPRWWCAAPAPHRQPGAYHMVLGFTYGKFPEMENRCSQHRGRMPLPDAVHQMVQIAHATRGDHRDMDTVSNRLSERDVKTLSCAVAVHRGQQYLAGAE